jgi:hypothetical protein
MSVRADEFFEGLRRRENDPVLQGGTGTVRFDLVENDKTEHWLVAVSQGEVAVSRRNSKADCVIRTERSLFEGMAGGEVNALAALLRGLVDVQGDPRLLVWFQRLFPGPPSSVGRVDAVGARNRP